MQDLRERTKRFALDVIRFCCILPYTTEFRIIRGQLVDAAASVGSNYRATQRAKSRADFISKMATVVEENDESVYWIELLMGLGYDKNPEVIRLKDEGEQLLRIMSASNTTARRNRYLDDRK